MLPMECDIWVEMSICRSVACKFGRSRPTLSTHFQVLAGSHLPKLQTPNQQNLRFDQTQRFSFNLALIGIIYDSSIILI